LPGSAVERGVVWVLEGGRAECARDTIVSDDREARAVLLARRGVTAHGAALFARCAAGDGVEWAAAKTAAAQAARAAGREARFRGRYGSRGRSFGVVARRTPSDRVNGSARAGRRAQGAQRAARCWRCSREAGLARRASPRRSCRVRLPSRRAPAHLAGDQSSAGKPARGPRAGTVRVRPCAPAGKPG
jgi:hypothetical protein